METIGRISLHDDAFMCFLFSHVFLAAGFWRLGSIVFQWFWVLGFIQVSDLAV